MRIETDLKILHSDNGSEFTSSTIVKFCNPDRFLVRGNAPRSQQKKKKIERNLQT